MSPNFLNIFQTSKSIAKSLLKNNWNLHFFFIQESSSCNHKLYYKPTAIKTNKKTPKHFLLFSPVIPILFYFCNQINPIWYLSSTMQLKEKINLVEILSSANTVILKSLLSILQGRWMVGDCISTTHCELRCNQKTSDCNLN